jgi:Bacterial Ig-like domain (group 2).
MRHARSFFVASIFVIAAGLACSSDSLTDPNAPPGLTLKLSPAADTMFVGDSTVTTEPVQLILTATSIGLPVQAPTGVAWTSANPLVATVSATGLVSAVAIGTTTITARVNDERATSTIVVAKALTRLTSTQPTH